MAPVDYDTFGRIAVDGQEEHSDVILLPSRRCLAGGAVTNTSPIPSTPSLPCTRPVRGVDEPRF